MFLFAASLECDFNTRALCAYDVLGTDELRWMWKKHPESTITVEDFGSSQQIEDGTFAYTRY